MDHGEDESTSLGWWQSLDSNNFKTNSLPQKAATPSGESPLLTLTFPLPEPEPVLVGNNVGAASLLFASNKKQIIAYCHSSSSSK